MKTRRLIYAIYMGMMLCSIASVLHAQFEPTLSQWIEIVSEYPNWKKLYQRDFDYIDQWYLGKLKGEDYRFIQKIRRLHRENNFLEAFKKELRTFQENTHQRLINGKWVGANPFASSVTSKAPDPDFRPFAEKRIVSPSDIVVTFGDLHGSLHTFVDVLAHLRTTRYLNEDFTLAPHVYVLFLGDFVDRGPYGIETLYTMLRLKNANPDRVILVRGNHEDTYMNFQDGDKHSFGVELEAKFFNLGTLQGNEDAENLLKAIKANLYEYLPVMLLLGNTNVASAFLYCVHGGLEIGFDPFPLTAMDEYTYEYISQLDRFDKYFDVLLDKVYDLTAPPEGPGHIEIGSSHRNYTPQKPRDIGCLWNDVVVDEEHANKYGHIQFTRGSRHMHAHSNFMARTIMEKFKIYAIIRAHQHADDPKLGPLFSLIEQHNGMHVIGGQTPTVRETRPLSKHSITTLGVLPGSGQSNLSEGFYAILKPKQDFNTPWDISLMHQGSPSSDMLVEDDDTFDGEHIDDDNMDVGFLRK